MAVDLIRQKELDAHPKGIQQIEFVGELKKLSSNNNNAWPTFILMILEKINETRSKFSQRSVTVL